MMKDVVEYFCKATGLTAINIKDRYNFAQFSKRNVRITKIVITLVESDELRRPAGYSKRREYWPRKREIYRERRDKSRVSHSAANKLIWRPINKETKKSEKEERKTGANEAEIDLIKVEEEEKKSAEVTNGAGKSRLTLIGQEEQREKKKAETKTKALSKKEKKTTEKKAPAKKEEKKAATESKKTTEKKEKRTTSKKPSKKTAEKEATRDVTMSDDEENLREYVVNMEDRAVTLKKCLKEVEERLHKSREGGDSKCRSCGTQEEEDATHVLMRCTGYSTARKLCRIDTCILLNQATGRFPPHFAPEQEWLQMFLIGRDEAVYEVDGKTKDILQRVRSRFLEKVFNTRKEMMQIGDAII